MKQDIDFPKTTLNTFQRGAAPEILVQENHLELVREMGAAAAVLLRNEDEILPLSADTITKISLIGSNAGPIPQGLNGCADQSCAKGHRKFFFYFSSFTQHTICQQRKTPNGNNYFFSQYLFL